MRLARPAHIHPPLCLHIITMTLTRRRQTLPIASVRDVMTALARGETPKMVVATNMNERSSRSHSVFTLYLRQERTATRQSIETYFHMVDLAGSERIKKSKAEGERLEEAQFINTSLMTLGRCRAARARSVAVLRLARWRLTRPACPLPQASMPWLRATTTCPTVTRR